MTIQISKMIFAADFKKKNNIIICKYPLMKKQIN